MDEFRYRLGIHATSRVRSQVSGYASKRLLGDGEYYLDIRESRDQPVCNIRHVMNQMPGKGSGCYGVRLLRSGKTRAQCLHDPARVTHLLTVPRPGHDEPKTFPFIGGVTA